uniref:MBD domain-containing protein n=1 Tax=Anopheles minimus TaxID=112268 RepID=A0A182W3U6_9DIPT
MANQPGLQQRETLAGEMLQHQHSTKQEPDEEEEEEGGSVEVRPNVGGKRRYSEHMCESDEDDFAGFEEDAASSENGTINSPRPLESMYEAMLTAAEKKLKKNIKLVEDDSVSDLQNSLKQEDMDIMGGTALGESNKNLLKRKVNVQINTQDDIFKVPFKYGWKRELVYRANMEGNSKDKGEVYYITPNGKKLRTRNDIVSALHDDLTMDNFTSAKSYSNVPKRSMPSAAHSTSMDNSGDLGKRVPKPKMPKGASPPLPTYNARASGHGQTPLSKSSTLNTHILTKVNATGASSLAAASGQRSNAHGVTGIPKANENSGISGKQAKAGVKNKVETCTIQCLPAMGMIPQLQCMVCYCMYHPECVNATTAEALARRFTCKSCMEDSMTAEIQHQQTYKESFGKFGTNTNGNGNINAAKPLVATNNGGSVSSKLVAKPTQNSSTPKEKAKRSQQHTAGSKTVTPAANASEGTCALSIAPTKDIPPQDVLVIGTHEYVVVPKGKPTGVKSKKSSSKSTNPLPQTPIKTSDDGRKMNNSAISGSTSSVKQTNCATDRVSVDDTSLTGGPGGGTHRHGGSAVGQHGSGRDPSNFLSDVSAGYACLMLSFNYLKVQELLRACSVCRMWNHLGNHPRFWKTVRMKNSYISDWAGMIAKLRKNGTKHLDLRKVLNVGSNDEMWQSFNEHIGQADQIEVIDLCRCSSTVVGNLLRSNPKLRVVNALAIKNDPIEFVNFEHGVNLEELRLKSSAAISLEGDLQQLAALRNLKHLSLTSISKLGATSIEALGSLLLLESLELGECTEMGSNLANVLTNLTALKRLRLEKGQENFDMFTILDGISKVRTLNQLELINCDVKTGFDRHISNCTNVKKLLLIPTYVSQSAATNRMVLKGIIKLHQTLETVVWAITVELLRVTELYIDANVEDAENQMGGSIPILKPVPGSDDPPSAVGSQLDLPEEVEIVPLKRVHSILKRKVPNTKLQILKIPFNNTWKQTLCDIS